MVLHFSQRFRLRVLKIELLPSYKLVIMMGIFFYVVSGLLRVKDNR